MKLRNSKKSRPRRDTKAIRRNGTLPVTSTYRQQGDTQTRLQTWEDEGGSVSPAADGARTRHARGWPRLPRLSSMVSMCSPAFHDAFSGPR